MCLYVGTSMWVQSLPKSKASDSPGAPELRDVQYILPDMGTELQSSSRVVMLLTGEPALQPKWTLL